MSDFSRRGFLGLAGAAGVALGTAACAGTGSSPAPAGTAGGGGQAGAANTIEFWSNHPGNSKAVEQELIKKFEAANSGMTVKLVDAGKNYEEVAQKLNAALAGGQLPDVVVVSDVTWFNFALNKQLAPLDEMIASSGVKIDDYVDALYADYTLSDKHYALPYSRSTPLFYYNKQMWQAAGLEDRGPKDWAEFREWAPKLASAIGSDKTPMTLPDGANYLDWVFQNMAWDMGGGYSTGWDPTFIAEGTVAAGQYLQELVKAGQLKLAKDPAPEFTAGLTACSMMSTGSLGGVKKDAKFEFGTAFLPGDNNCPTGGAGIGIPAGISDARKANALKFMEFMTNPESTVTFTQATGYMPVRKSAVDLPAEKTFLEQNPNSKTAIDQLPHTRSQDNARVLVPGGGARIGKALDQIAAGQDVKTVFAALQTETQQVIDSQIKPKL